LQELQNQGFQVIDLEHLAGHKGSAFGNLAFIPQPSQEYFENLLVQQLAAFYQIDEHGTFFQAEPIWIENESRRIGLINLTELFYKRLQQAKLYTLIIPFEERLQFVTDGYGQFEKEKLVNAIIRIQKRLGGLDAKNAINHLLENETKACFSILLKYYDKVYHQTTSNSKRNPIEINSDRVDPKQNAHRLLTLLSQKS
jgi:tRNA 2-selenouridine synthase